VNEEFYMNAPSKQNLNTLVAVLTIALSASLVGCGKTKRSGANEAVSGSGVSVVAPPVILPPDPIDPVPDVTNSPALSYEFISSGSSTYTTPAITTDNILKVKFTVGTTQDNANLPQYNATHQATELSVVIVVNGREVTPTFTSANYIYGRIGEVSGVIDFSQNLTPGTPVTISVKDAKNDFYCTYLASTNGYLWNQMKWMWEMVNPLANQYPGCRKPVKPAQTINGKASPAHRWSGKLIVQTNNTVAI
jgi:hypothetical protein